MLEVDTEPEAEAAKPSALLRRPPVHASVFTSLSAQIAREEHQTSTFPRLAYRSRMGIYPEQFISFMPEASSTIAI